MNLNMLQKRLLFLPFHTILQFFWLHSLCLYVYILKLGEIFYLSLFSNETINTIEPHRIPLLTPQTGWTWHCRFAWPWARGGPVADQWTQSWCADWSCFGSSVCPCCQLTSYRQARAERWRAGRGQRPDWTPGSQCTDRGFYRTVGCCHRSCHRRCPGSPCLRRASPGWPASPACRGGYPVLRGTCQSRACPESWPCCWLWCQTIWGGREVGAVIQLKL